MVQRRSELGRAARGAEACAHEAAPTWNGEHERGSRETRWQWQTAAAAGDARRGSDIEGEGAWEEGKRAKRWELTRNSMRYSGRRGKDRSEASAAGGGYQSSALITFDPVLDCRYSLLP